ncbi:hypothetical protein C8E17_2106 [Serratia plymuthica]|nr:hypothetical protein C8E17_2106 [Serratia plymuthica]CAI2493230.1 Uncharacterised protein [Serratia plymuthica]
MNTEGLSPLFVRKDDEKYDGPVREKEQRCLTLEALRDVEQMNFISHEAVLAWAISLRTDSSD